MKEISWCKHVGYILTLSVITLFLACEGPEYPENIWDPEDQGKLSPVITDVEPETGSFAGVGEVTITGENFSSDKEENLVFFNAKRATILSASNTVLTVQAPNITGDSLRIKVSVVGAFLFAEYYPYKLEAAVIEYGGFGEFDDVYGLAMDTDENLYVSYNPRKVMIVTPDEPNSSNEYASTSFLKADGMKMGPEGYLYCARRHKNIERIPPGGGANETFATLDEKAYDLDFDSLGTLYAGGKDSTLFSISPEGDVKVVAKYPDEVVINSIRVFNDYVYIAGEYTGSDTTVIQEGIWRNEIIYGDTLGPAELVFDWGSFAGVNGPKILAITFAADGDMFIGADREEAIYVLHPPYDGTPEPFYSTVLSPPSNRLCWGNGQYLYVNRRSDDTAERRVLRIATGKDGAPYFGRQ